MMTALQTDQLEQVETTCGSLLYELQVIWNEVGETDDEMDKMLLEIEQECLEIYRRKVDLANRTRAQLRQAIAESEAELAAIFSAMGERPVHIRQSDQSSGSLKAELRIINPQLEEMRKKKQERIHQFKDVLEQIQKVSNEIYISTNHSEIVVDEVDLSLKKLEELHKHLQMLQKEKSDRLRKVLDLLSTLNSLCLVLGMDFKDTIREVHPSLDDSEAKNISNETIERLACAIENLREVKIQRMKKLQDLAMSMLEMWNLMDTPIDEQQKFQNVTRNIAALEDEITEPNTLSVDFINYVEEEVSRLEELKASKMKELVLKKRSELEEICRRTHIVTEPDKAMEFAIEAIESGTVDPSSVLEQVEFEVAKVKEEAFSRKDILDRVEKWIAACEEECWLEEYNRDENRYNSGRGSHLTLKRAEKARAAVNKLPAMVEALMSKTRTWEIERSVEFMYDGVRLLSMLEEDKILRHEKEQERRRQRDQKKLQGQLIAEQEVLFGSKPSPSKQQSAKKVPRVSTGSSRRVSLGPTPQQTPRHDPHHTVKPTPRRAKKSDQQLTYHDEGRRGLDVAGPTKKRSFNSSDMSAPESPIPRKPFSPISSRVSSRANTENSLEDDKHSGAMQKTILSYNAPLENTPSKVTSIFADAENMTPRTMPIPVPSTPSSVSVPMQMAATPAPPVAVLSETRKAEETPDEKIHLLYGARKPEEIPEEKIEYSFEERRAGFFVTRAH